MAQVTKPKKEVKIIKEAPKKEKQDTTRLTYKDKRELNLLPEKIDKLSNEIKALEERLNFPNLYVEDLEKFNSISNSIVAKRAELELAENRWL